MDEIRADGWIDELLAEGPWLRRLARRLVADDASADDLAQATYAAVLAAPPPPVASLRAWLTTVARNLVRKGRRGDTRRVRREERAARPLVEPPTADVVARQELRQRVGDAVLGLAEPYRTTILLRFFEGLPPRAVATRMEVPVETVRTRTRRAVARLRATLDRDCGPRERWIAMILPLADLAAPASPAPVAPASAAPASVTAAVAGGVIVAGTSKKIVVAGLLACLLLGGGLALHVTTDDGDTRSPASADVDGERSADGGMDARTDGRRRVTGPPRTGTTSTPGEAPPADAVALHEVAVTVRRADGEPAGGARVVLFGEDGLQAGDAPASGTLTLALNGAPKGVLVSVPGLPPRHAEVAPDARALTVEVPAGLTISGIVRVGGVAPRAPIELRLHCAEVLDAYDHVPATVAQALSARGEWRTHTVTTTTAGGRFTFTGFARESDDATIEVEGRYALAGSGGTYVSAAVPQRDLVIELVPRGILSGRVVVPGGGEPANSVRVHARFLSPDPDASAGASTWGLTRGADEDGTFRAGMPPWPAYRIELVVEADEGFLRRELESTDGSRDLTLGDLELQPYHVVRARAVDEHGAALDDDVRWSVPASDLRRSQVAAGSATVELQLTRLRDVVRAEAIGYATTEAELGSDGEVHTVTLAPAPLLRVTTGGPGTLLRIDAGVELRSPGLPGAADWDSASDTAHWWTPPDEGPLVVAGLPTGRPIDVLLHDRLGSVVARRTLRLEPSDHLDLDLRPTGPTRRLRGVVVDATGAPVAGAFVYVSDVVAAQMGAVMDHLVVATTVTDDEGRFDFTEVRAAAVEIAVAAEGSLPWYRTVLPVDGRPLRAELGRGRDVVLDLRDADEQPVRGAMLAADVPGRPRFAWPSLGWEAFDEGGVYRLRDVPRESFALTVSRGDRSWRVQVPADEPEASFVLE